MKEGQTAVQIANRRRELLLEYSRNNLGEAIKDLSKRYQVDETTLYHDWARREEWISDIVTLDDPSLIKSYFTGLEEVVKEAEFLIKTADNSNAKVGALRLKKETYAVLLDILVKAGYLQKGNEYDQIHEITLTWVNPKDSKITTNQALNATIDNALNIPAKDNTSSNANANDNTTNDNANANDSSLEENHT